MQHAVREGGADDLDMIGEAKAPLETAPGDATVQVAAAVLVLLLCPLPVTRSVFSWTVMSSSAVENPATAIVSR